MGDSIISSSVGPALWLTIDREAARNAIDPQVMRELIDELLLAKANPSVACVVLTGAGSKAFCAGGNLGGGMAAGAVQQHLDRALLSTLFRTMRSLGKPVIARVNGHALGGGFGLALACDLIVSVDHAEFGTPEISIGLWPYIITSVIQRNLPEKFALEMMMLGKRIPAAKGAAMGFVNEVVPVEELDAAIARWVEALASKSPLILRLGKDSYYAAADMDFDSALSYLESQLTVGLQAEDAMEGIQAFIQKRAPEWKGR
ncbi:MAG: enoyl-CoA hydratase/isomerase family protein [Actinomycetota bacterium]